MTPQGDLFHMVPKREPWIREAARIWTARFGGVAPFGKIGKALKPLCAARGGGDVGAGWAQVKPVWERYLREHGDFASPAGFAEKFLLWVGNGKDADDSARQADATRAWERVLACRKPYAHSEGAYWAEADVRENCGERSARAFMSAGGGSAFASMLARDREEPFVRRAFVKAWLALK